MWDALRGGFGKKLLSNTDTIASSNTSQILKKGSEANTFARPVRLLLVLHASQDAYIAKTSAEVDLDEDGGNDCRIFIPADVAPFAIPWTGQDVYFLNAVDTETPMMSVVGIP